MPPPLLRVAIVGPESCGKSTLAQALQVRLERCGVAAVRVDEYARAYYAQREYRPCLQDVIAIARGQLVAERNGALLHPRVLLCDSTVLTCAVWADVAFGVSVAEFAAQFDSPGYDLTLLACPDIPWAADPLRTHPHARNELLQRYRVALAAAGVAAVEIRGEGLARERLAWQALRQNLPELPKI